MRKKCLSMLMAGVMALSLSSAAMVTGCTTTTDDSGINWDVDLSNPITIKALYPATGISGFAEGNTDTAEIIENATGYHVEYSELSDANADNEVNSILTTKEEYHIMKLDLGQYSAYLEDDLFLDLTELLTETESGRILYEYIDLMDYGWDSVTYTKSDGTTGIYAIPDFGYCVMEDTALVWNTQHLIEVGYYTEDEEGNKTAVIPESLSEVTDALEKMQNLYGATNSNYHAFGLGGSNSARVNAIMSAFDCPLEFYYDEDTEEIQQYIFSDTYTYYCEYMSYLRNYGTGILSDSWQNSSSADLCSKFASEMTSCVYMSYWWVTPLVNAVVTQGTVASNMGVSNDYQTVHDECITWQTRIRGDGSHNSAVQMEAKIQGGDDGVSYYTVIPWYMAEDAVYVIDFLAKKIQNSEAFNMGTEGVHWNRVDAPEGAPEYDPDDPYCMLDYEDYVNKIIYLRPYSYTIQGETISGGGYWIQLTDRYVEQIVDNSQYSNGTNCVSGEVIFHLRETGFDAWQVTVPMDDTIITNPMTMAPPTTNWSVVNILSRTKAVRGIASAIDTTGSVADSIALTRASMYETFVKKNGVKYYYWSQDIVDELTTWYKAVKLADKS